MTKFPFLLFLCLLVFSNLFAQTDSTRPVLPPAAGSDKVSDTVPPIARPRHTPRRDSTVRHDSLSRRNAGVHHDSTGRPAVIARFDSLSPAKAGPHDSIPVITPVTAAAAPPPPVPAGANGPAMLSYWRSLLVANPSYNFLGKPVVQPFEIHRPNSKDSLFYLMLGILFFFALVRIFFEKYFSNLMTLFFRMSLRQQQIREQVLQTPLPSLLLNILFVITGGLYACFLLHYSRFGIALNFWILYLYCMMGLSVIYLGKFLVLKFCGWVFNISRATDIYIFVVFLVNKMLGIFLLPFLILITFSGTQTREIFITISLAMIFVLLAYRVMAAYRPIRNEIKLTPFHFFLYLCAFEIAPLLLIYKVLLAYLEKVY